MNFIKKATVLALALTTSFSAMLCPLSGSGTTLLDSAAITASAESIPSSLGLAPYATQDIVLTPNNQKEVLRSSNGKYALKFQSDGNLVIRNRTQSNNVTWNSATYFGDSRNQNRFTNLRFRFQTDGNLVFRANVTNRGNADMYLWTTFTNSGNTTQKGYRYDLKLTNNGQLELHRTYKGMGYTDYLVWSSAGTKVSWHVDRILQNWSNKPIYCGSSTIALEGCAIASYAMIYSFYKGLAPNVQQLEAMNQQPYVNQKGWATFNIGRYTSEEESWGNFDANAIAQKLKNGPVIVHSGNNNPRSHFVVVYECTRGTNPSYSDLKVMDPSGNLNYKTVQDLCDGYGTDINQLHCYSCTLSRL